MRNAFAHEITALAAANEKVVLLSGDIGNRLFDKFKEIAPDRFFNCGVAEANMMSVAAGMALSGYRPIVYTITPFVTTRCLEQIRDDVCYHSAPVTIVGVGSGLGYASLGPTHQSMEDIAFLRPLPNLKLLCPCDPGEARSALRAALADRSPCYIRLGKKGEPTVNPDPDALSIGRSVVLRAGGDVCLIGTGTMTKSVMDVADLLAQRSLSATVVHMHTVKPMDTAMLTRAFHDYPLVCTMEEHGLAGGMGSAIAEWLSEQVPGDARLLRFATQDHFLHAAGGRRHVLQHHALLPEQIADRICTFLGNRKSSAA